MQVSTTFLKQIYYKGREICNPKFEKMNLLFQEKYCQIKEIYNQKIQPKAQKLGKTGTHLYKHSIQANCKKLFNTISNSIENIKEDEKLCEQLFGQEGWLRGLPFSIVSSVAIGYLLGRVSLKTAALYGTIHYLATTTLDKLTIGFVKKGDSNAGKIQIGFTFLVGHAASHYLVTQIFKRTLKPEIALMFSIASYIAGQAFRCSPIELSSLFP
jgi:hypothetical protein